jgi:predicted metal-dependent phosphoesterase TrpH
MVGDMSLKVDFHTHTSVSKDSLTKPERLILTARRKGLDRVVITDHNSIAGAMAAYRLDPEFIIVGEEIMTTNGELLAAYVTEEIPRGLSPRETIQRLRDQGAFISVSHPFDSWRNGAWKMEDLKEIAKLVDAIEIFNARCSSASENQRAADFANEHHLAGTAGSDAHAAFELGAAHMILPDFSGGEELKKAILQAHVQGGLSPFWVHFASFYARWRKMVV